MIQTETKIIHSNLKLTAMRTKITKTDFTFRQTGYGRYQVTYQSPATGKEWTADITDMEIIDATKGQDYPLQKDLEWLKKMCKR